VRKFLLPLLVVVVLAPAMSGCGPGPFPLLTPVPSAAPTSIAHETKPIVIDTDMAADDWMAILYLLQRPDVSVRAITVTGTGEAHCGPGMENALGLLSLAGNADAPVSCGRETPLGSDHAFPESWRESVDNLMGLSLPENPNPPSSQTAVQLLASVLILQ